MVRAEDELHPGLSVDRQRTSLRRRSRHEAHGIPGVSRSATACLFKRNLVTDTLRSWVKLFEI